MSVVRSLGVIVARAGSKRLPLKNLRPLLDHPLVAWSLRAALASALTRVVVSTEDDRIAAAAETYGGQAPFRRPFELVADYANSEDIVGHALDWAEHDEGRPYDVVVTLQPTTPFVQPGHIDACLAAVAPPGVNGAITARPSAEPPSWLFDLDADGFARPWLSGEVRGEREHGQLVRKLYIPTGAVYACRVDALRSQRSHITYPLRLVDMERDRAVDIDDEHDFTVAEAIGRKRKFELLPLRSGSTVATAP